MAGGGRVKRHPFMSAAAALLAALLVVTALGGFRRADPPYPDAEVGSSVDLGRFTLTVTGARLLTTQPDGDELEPGERLLAVEGTVLNTDTSSGVLASRLVTARFGRADALDVGLGTSEAGRYFQPRVTTPLTLTWAVEVGADVPDAVTLVFFRESYDWNNLTQFGPTWSGGVPFRSMRVPVQR